MVPDRRRTLRAIGATALTTLAGCTALADLDTSSNEKQEYTVDVDAIRESLVEHTLYEPGDDPLFGQPAQQALDAILPDGRYTAYGYEPVPADAYMAHENRYYQTKLVVTGQKRIERLVVRLSPVEEAAVPQDAIDIDELPDVSARPVKILHSYEVTNGEGGAAELVEDGTYVLRRPAERESRLATELDGAVVTFGSQNTWAYRIEVARTRINETANTAFAVEVASDTAAFREIAFATRVDVRLDEATLSAAATDLLERILGRETYRETTPLSAEFEAVLDALDLQHVDDAMNGLLLWYDDDLYRYGLYVNDVD